MVKPRKISASVWGSRIRDRLFNEEIYDDRAICEGFCGALTNWFGNRVPCFLRTTTITRVALRVISYALRILLRIVIS